MVELQVRIPEVLTLDLYETDPIRLNISIEDIESTEATSTYSQTFRLPNTSKNAQFFKSAFSVNGLDFDVTVKYEATINVNNIQQFKGHIRLVKIYSRLSDTDVDYEIAFLGQTRDLSSAVRGKTLNQLDTSSLNHFVTYENITLSWLAQPDPNDTNGLKEGNIIYPLINFGNSYNEANIVTDTRISNNGTSNYFTNPLYPLTKNRFKPMVRARWLFEKIFEEAGFTIQSNFFDTELFMKTYVSAFGNDSRNIIDLYSSNVFYSTLTYDYQPTSFNALPFTVNEDPNNNYIDYSEDSDSPLPDFQYTAAIDGDYQIKTAVIIDKEAGEPDCTLYLSKNPINTANWELVDSQVFSSNPNNQTQFIYTYDQTLTLTAGETIGVAIIGPCTVKSGSFFRVPEAESNGISVSYLLDNEYKQIDFIKDILTTFRLVLIPSNEIENHFIVEPWVSYMGTGQIRDWTKFVDDSKDIVIEPTFYTQEQKITWSFAEDKDWLNALNSDQFKEEFGTLTFDSNNELIKGEKKYTTKYAGTPVTQIDGAALENGGYANLIIPHIYTKDVKDDLVLNKPIKAKTRLMFWNGMKDTNVSGYTDGYWYMIDDSLQSVGHNQYPRVSPYYYFPLTYSSPILMWQKEPGYVNFIDEVGAEQDKGLSLYDTYWSRYINLLYDKWGRKVTLTMYLQAEDLVNFEFKDLIQIRGTYYYVSKISNLAVGTKEPCTVELIKFNPFRLPSIESLLIWDQWNEVWNTTTASWGD